MEEAILQKTKQLQKSNHWGEAAKILRQHIESEQGWSIILLKNYSRCLRKIGEYNKAKVSLDKYQETFANSHQLWLEYYHVYNHQGKWRKAQKAGEKIVNLKPRQANYYFLLGKVYAANGDKEFAKSTFKQGLELKHQLPFIDIIYILKKTITKNTKEVDSSYQFLKGINNLGVIIHYYQGKKYITKISKMHNEAKREALFYENLQTSFPQLREISPKYVHSQVISNIQYLTLEFIETAKQKPDLKTVIETSNVISSIPAQEVTSRVENRSYSYTIKNRTISIAIYFTKIHDKEHNEQLFKKLRQFAKQRKYSYEMHKVIDQLEAVIMENEIYQSIQPEKEYTLVHADYKPNNIVLDDANNHLKALDWGAFTIGLRFTDMARYFAVTKTDYLTVKRIYLHQNKMKNPLSIRERILFLYLYIALHFVNIRRRKENTTFQDFIAPALTDLKQLSQAKKVKTHE